VGELLSGADGTAMGSNGPAWTLSGPMYRAPESSVRSGGEVKSAPPR
jgi:hypothetical protein